MPRAGYKFNQSAIADYMLNSSAVWEALDAIGQEAAEHWRSIAPVGTRDHKLKSGYWNRAGDYKRSIRVRHMKNPTRQKVRVEAGDFKKFWLEYGTVKTRPQHLLAQTRTYMAGRPNVSRE